MFVLLIQVPATALGQMAPYGPAYGTGPTQMGGSCASCQQSSVQPNWLTSSYDEFNGGYEGAFDNGDFAVEGYEAGPFGNAEYQSGGFESSCGCGDISSTGGSGECNACQMPYGASNGMNPYGCDSCGMTPDVYGYGPPAGFPSECNQCNAGEQCNSCGPAGYAVPSFGCQTCCPCGNAAPLWFGAEALIWSTPSSYLPLIVTTSEAGTQGADAGIIGRPGTQVLYGGNDLFTGTHGGFRLRGGVNFDQCGVSGMDAEFFMLGNRNESYHGVSNGTPILARPFLNAQTGLNDAQLVAYPGLVNGSIDVNAKSSLNSGALHYREVFWKECAPGDPCADSCWRSAPRSFSLGFQIGPRFINLRETIGINEQLTGQGNSAGTKYSIQDSFRTKNQFWGAEFGLFGNRQRGRWSLDGAARLAVGGTNQQLDISGQTAVTAGGVTTTNPGGFLAQSTNSGSFKQNRFALVPQFDVGISYQMTNNWRASVGYSLLYWGSVLRATEQIDPVVNPGLLPPPQDPLIGELRPTALMHESSYLAHGITLGLERRW